MFRRYPGTSLALAVALTLALVGSACGSEPEGTATGAGVSSGGTGSDPTTAGADGATSGPPGSADTTSDDTTPGLTDDTVAPTSGAGPGGTDDGSGGSTLPGEHYDIGPAEGEPMAVVGVRFDDALNVRTAPDPSAPVVTRVAALDGDVDLRSAGEGRLLTRGAWWKVTVDGQEGWANTSFLGALGAVTDATDELAAELPATTADDLQALVDAIVEVRGSEEPPSKVVLVTEPTTTAVTFDLLGLGDDAVRGERYALTVRRVGSRVELVRADRIPICSRGVSDGRCL
jgi:hypothetical protein